MKIFVSYVFSGLMILAITCATGWAQSTAQVNGTVSDSSGAVLPGVEVTLTQTETGLSRSAVTNETGSYSVTNLPVGPYRLEGALPGFRTYAQTGIILTVGANPIINLNLEVGQVSETVEVLANATQVETRNTGIGQVIDNVRVLELPLNARQVTELILLSGAAVAGGAQGTQRNYPTLSISVGGGMNNGLTYILDGGTHNDPFNNLNLPLPFPDALQEFKVETSAVPAQYGQHSSGAVNAVTKSGTNELHGSLFEFVRNKVFNARNAFALQRDGLKRNQFGGVVGGPIVKNKLFFFGGYQGTVQRSEPTDSRAYVPTAAMLAGDWTAIASAACNSGRPIALRAPFVNNRIDPTLFSKPSLELVKRLPATTEPCGEVRFGRRTDNDEHVVIARIDYQWSEKHSIFGRYQMNRLFIPSNYDGKNIVSVSEADFVRRPQEFVLGDTYSISPSMVSSFRGTLLRPSSEKTSQDYFSLAELGVRMYHPPEVPKIANVSVAGEFSIFGGTSVPAVTNSTVYQFAEDISWVGGAHQIGWGVNFIHSIMNNSSNSTAVGQMNFTAQQTGRGLGDFMLGRASAYQQQSPTTYYYRQNYVGLYLQDTWKATRRVTVSAGLRWEPFMPMYDGEGRTLFFSQDAYDKGARSTVYKNAPIGLLFPGDSGYPYKSGKSIGPAALLHFAPRLGLAWDPKGDGRMAIRAAYGIFFDYPHFYEYSGMLKDPPWGYGVTLTNPGGGFENPWQDTPGGNPFPARLSPDIRFTQGGDYLSVPPSMKYPYMNQWNVSIQKGIGADWLVAANYLGNNVIHLTDALQVNPSLYMPGASCVIGGRTYTPCTSTANVLQRRKLSLQNPTEGLFYGNVIEPYGGGTRNYNAMVLSVQRRRSAGVTVQGNYTFGHCIDDGHPGANLDGRFGGELNERRSFNRGNCDLDRRHNLNMSTVYETPQFSNRALRILGTGWQVSGIVRAASGNWLTIATGIDSLATNGDTRPNQILASPYGTSKSFDQYLNPAAFSRPGTGEYGTMGRSNIQGPGSIRIDMGLTRKFQILEGQTVEFRAEAFNLPNHLNPGNPNTSLSSTNFGRITTSGDERIIQLALKYVF